MKKTAVLVAALALAALPQATAQADETLDPQVQACLNMFPGAITNGNQVDGVADLICVAPGDGLLDNDPLDIAYWGVPLVLTPTEEPAPTPTAPPEATPEVVVPDEPVVLSAVAVTSDATTAAYVTFTRTSSGPVAVVKHTRVAGAKAYVTKCGTRTVRSRYLKARIHARRGTACRVRAYNAAGVSSWSRRVIVRQARLSA